MKEALLETWLIFSTCVWVINGLSLWVLPLMVWKWFYLLPLFIGTTFNLIIIINVYLNRIHKLNKL